MVASAAGQQFQLMEASINEIRRGLQSGKLTCHSLVENNRAWNREFAKPLYASNRALWA